MGKATAGPVNPDQAELDEMFSGQDPTAGNGGDEDWDEEDLLGNVEEDDSEGWVPKEKNEGVVGKVVKVTTTRSDFAKDGEDPFVPTIVIETKSGMKWRIIGFAAVLRRELEDKDPQVGDILAVKYFGEKSLKTGKFQGRPYKHFGVNVIRARA